MEVYRIKVRLQQDEVRDKIDARQVLSGTVILHANNEATPVLTRGCWNMKHSYITISLPSAFALPGDILAFPTLMWRAQGNKLSGSFLGGRYCWEDYKPLQNDRRNWTDLMSAVWNWSSTRMSRNILLVPTPSGCYHIIFIRFTLDFSVGVCLAQLLGNFKYYLLYRNLVLTKSAMTWYAKEKNEYNSGL